MATETPKEIIDRLMSKVTKEHIDDVLYQQWICDELPHIMFERFHAMPMRSDDVIMIGVPRCGNHWAYYVLTMILQQNTDFPKRSYIHALTDFWTEAAYAEFALESSPRLICTHARVRRYEPEVLKNKPRIVYLLRNPKDAMASMFKLYSGFKEEYAFSGSWDDFFEVSVAGEYTWGSWCDHVLSMERFMEEHPEVPVYIHQFEDMKTDPVKCIKKLCAFLGVSDHLAEDIAKASGIENMRKEIATQDTTNNQYYRRGIKPGFIQKGVTGNWKNIFTVEQNARFNRIFDEKIKDSKLGARVREYI